MTVIKEKIRNSAGKEKRDSAFIAVSMLYIYSYVV